MKYTLGILASLALVSASQAVQVTVTLAPQGGDLTGGTARGVFDNSGAPVDGGYLGYGTFASVPDFSQLTGAEVDALFGEFGDPSTVTGTTLGTATIPGTFAYGTSQGIPNASDPIASANIYVVIGNNATLADSTELLVVNTGTPFGSDDPVPGLVSYDMLGNTGIIAHGNATFAGTISVAGVGDFAAPNSYQLAPLVPEPSSSLLFGFAGLALLIRRKR